jgi:hypothetical protein
MSLRIALAASAFLAAVPAQAGKLSRTRSAVRSSSSNSSSGGSSGSSSGGTVRKRSGGGLPPVLACVTPMGAIFCLPYFLIEQREPKRNGVYHSEGFFLRHPYQDGAPGRMVIVKDPPAETDPLAEPPKATLPPSGSQRHAARLALEYAHDLDGVLRPTARLQLEFPLRLGLESAWTHFIEPLSGGGFDRLTIGDTNLTFRFAQSPSAQFWVGLGLRLLTDAVGTDPGFNFTYGFDLFPGRPLVISASIDLGNLGLAFALHGRATVGVALGVFELYAGYDAMLVDPVLFHGPLAGLRVWF